MEISSVSISAHNHSCLGAYVCNFGQRVGESPSNTRSLAEYFGLVDPAYEDYLEGNRTPSKFWVTCWKEKSNRLTRIVVRVDTK